jgi:glycosyltransferase involved in cell wall biosynthesis
LLSLGPGGAKYALRNVLNALQMNLSWRVKKAMRLSSSLVSATPIDELSIWRLFQRKSTRISEVAASPEVLEDRQVGGKCDSLPSAQLQIVWCGRLDPIKALHLALMAISQAAKIQPIHLTIVGDGPCRMRWEALANRLGIQQFCTWVGMVDRSRAMQLIDESDVLLYTSIQDATATTVIEALERGKPVICHDACGFGAIVDDTCGIKIKMKTPSGSADGFAAALVRLAMDREMLKSLAGGALRQASRVTWDGHVATMLQIYGSVSRS